MPLSHPRTLIPLQPRLIPNPSTAQGLASRDPEVVPRVEAEALKSDQLRNLVSQAITATPHKPPKVLPSFRAERARIG